MREMYWFLSQLINTDDAAVAKTKLVLTTLSETSKMCEQMNYGAHDFPVKNLLLLSISLVLMASLCTAGPFCSWYTLSFTF